MSLTERVARGVKASLLARLLYVGSNAALLLLLTRYLLTPAEFGRLQFVLSVVGVAIFVGTLGIPKATARYVTEYAENEPGQVPHLLKRSLAVLVGLAVAVGIAIAAFSGLLARLLRGPELAPYLLLGGAFVAAKAVVTYLTTVFQGFNRVTYSAVLSAVNGLGRVVFAVGFVLAGFGALGALAGYVVAFAVAAVVGLALLYTRFYRGHERDDEAEPGLMRRVLEYSVPTTATRASVVLDSKVDTVLLGVLAGPVAVGVYALARQIADVCVVPAKSLGFTISPALGEQSAAGDEERAARLYERSLENVLLLYVPAAAGLALVAEPVVRYVFTAEYMAAVPIVQLYGLFVIVRAVHKITGSGLDYLGLARVRAVARATSAVCNVGLNLLLIPRYGALGAGIATVITYSLYTIVNVYFLGRELPLRPTYLAERSVRIVVVALLVAGGTTLALPHVTGLPTLLATVALGGAIWATLSVASGLVDPAEVRSLLG